MIFRFNLLSITSIILLLFGFGSISAQNSIDENALLFKTGDVSFVNNIESFIEADLPQSNQIVNGYYYRLIQFSKIPDAEEKQLLADLGIILLEYIPNKAYYAAISTDLEKEAFRLFPIRGVYEIDNSFKQAPSILNQLYPDWAMHEEGKIDVFIHYFQNLEMDLVIEELNNFPITILSTDDLSDHLLARININNIDLIIEQAYVLYIEPVYPEPEPENDGGRTLHRSNTLATEYMTGRHYDGSGIKVMLQDDGTIGPHIDYEGRIGAQYLSYNGGDHGDHTSGTIFGAGNLDPKGKGMAFGVELYVYGAAPSYPGFEAIPSHYYEPGVRISSTSYSNGCNAGYTSLTRTMDIQIRSYPGLMHVFSAGNAGTDNCGYGAGSGWGNITGGHKAAKNVIAVGNLNNYDVLSSSSSRGPAHDGRIKPDVCGKGSSVYSTTNPNSYTVKSGTSMSCPGTAGTLAQLYQAYKEINNQAPNGGLIKGIILNTADDLGNSGPDFKYGWGRINGLRAVETIEEGRHEMGTVSQDEVDTHQIEVPENVKQVRIMVYWSDYQASASTNKALVNDIDIVLTSPSFEDIYPWVLDHSPNSASLNAPAERAIDHLNNVEQITIDNPEPGVYSLTISGYEISQGPQDYYIIHEFIEDGLTLTHPYGGESFVPGETETLRWDAYTDTIKFSLEYSVDGGITWTSISDNVNQSVHHFNWDVPSFISGNVYVRVNQGGFSSMNMAPVSIIPVPENIIIDWSCETSFRVHWDEVYGASGYEVSLLGEKYMDSVGFTEQNSFIFEGIDGTDLSWFSVKTIGPDNAVGRRAVAELRIPGVYNCYATDAKMEKVLLSEWGKYQDCQDLEDLPIEVIVRNFGSETFTGMEIGYQINDGEIVTDTYNGSLDADSVLLFTFDDTVDLSVASTYVIKTWVKQEEDMNPENDTLITPVEVVSGTVLIPPFTQTFDAFEKCTSLPTCENLSCELSEGWINPENEVFDDIDWITYSGATPTSGTGPSGDHTSGTGNYLFLEASVLCFYKEATLISPCIDLTATSSPTLNFWYHAYGSNIGRLHLDIISDLEIIGDIMIPIVGNQGNEWKEVYADLSEYNGQIINLRFRGYTGNGHPSDLAIDDISVLEAVGIGDPMNVNSFFVNVYPNPGNGQFNIFIPELPGETLEITIGDLFGRNVFSKEFVAVRKTFHDKIDLSSLSNGVYFITVRSGEQVSNRKLVVQ